MRNILIFGAGRSATVLIDYLLGEAQKHDWFVTVADADLVLAQSKVNNHSNGEAVKINIKNAQKRRKLIDSANVVISLLPVNLHYLVVKDCIKHKKHIVTASYLTREMYGLSAAIKDAEIIMLGEMGLDPGIDHMSAMEAIEKIKKQGGKITSFKSFTGGLIAPEYDDNPWHYKFTWNPRNVVLAGQGTSQYLLKGKKKYVPYNRVFLNTEEMEVPGYGRFEAYANRDSLFYQNIYGLEDIPTLIRGTFRAPGFCKAWNAFVKLGWTDDTYPIVNSENLTYREFLESYLFGVMAEYPKGYSIQHRLADFLQLPVDDPVMEKLEWLGIFTEQKINLHNATPAMILLELLLQKWSLKEGDKDMVVMQHQFEYDIDGKKKSLVSSMVIKGDDQQRTAMAKLVGLPLGIFVKLMLEGKIKKVGIHLPVIPEIYEPVLKELRTMDVKFVEEEREM